MRIRLELRDGWRLAGDDLSRPEAALAAAELEAALGPPGAEGVELALAHGDGRGDGFVRQASAERVEVRGESARGLLFGVYATLEELGVDWPWPGEQRVTGGDSRLEDRVEDRPALPGRCLVLGERALVEHADEWIAWAARRRLNCLFVHVSTETGPQGAAPEAAWRERREGAVALARERGMTLEHGGHLLPELLPRRDVRALAEGRSPGAAGHDTIEVPREVRPRENVCLVFAPRERCYEHARADPDCRTNACYRESLQAQVEHFDAAGASSPRVFEYWFDAIRFGGDVPDLTETMAEDLAFYRQAGVHTVQILITGHGDVPGPHPNLPAFARLAWDPGARRSAGH